jgi:hypothetical protein
LTVAFKAVKQLELMFREAAKRLESTLGYILNCARIGWAKSNMLPAKLNKNMTTRTVQPSKILDGEGKTEYGRRE